MTKNHLELFELNKAWQEVLGEEFLSSKQFTDLIGRVETEYRENKICPERDNLFSALNLCPYDSVKVVILGQDPYHTPRVANGLAFSTSAKGAKLPPSLRNIIKEVQNSFTKCDVADGDLRRWANQGVLLLNTCLTVREGEPLSHADIGWDCFTGAILKAVSKKDDIVFVLWGSHARKYRDIAGANPRNLVLESAHPSPLSASRGFFGNNHFLLINKFLESRGKVPIKF